MKLIIKVREPQSLTRHRQQRNASYDNYAEKDDLRQALLREQGAICCYCMRRISVGNMKIEHWASQARHMRRQLDYQNLLGSCDGGAGAPKHLQHCDVSKGESDISINPADQEHNCEGYVKYRSDGAVYANDGRMNNDLQSVLNLNLQRLCENRKAVLDGMLDGLRKKRPNGVWTKGFLEREQRRWSSRMVDSQFHEYCLVVSYYLSRKIARTRS